MAIFKNIRELKLYTPNKRSFLSLNDSRFLLGEVTGLGNQFNIAYKDTQTGKVMTNIKPEFEPISATIYFNADGTNGYRNYKYFMDFLALMQGQVFAIEYNDGVTKKMCDVLLKNAPKSQINNEGVFSETFIFERQYFYYEEQEEVFALKSTDASKVTFPLPFPFGFTGQSFVNSYRITNNFYAAAPLKITIKGPITGSPIIISLKDANGINTISQIRIIENCLEGETFIIDASTKKIIRNVNGNIQNGYYLVDKRYQSFLYLPLGTYTIEANISMEDIGEIDISIKRYLLD